MANTMNYLPSLGMSGLYDVGAPYSALISATTNYKCVGVISLSGAVSEGYDPLNNIYLANGDTQANYLSDLAAGVSIITLVSDAGAVVKFPSSALLQVPVSDGVLYRNVVLGISLGATPDTMDLSTIQTAVSNLVYDMLGVLSTTFLTTVGNTVVLSPTQDAAISSARAANINQASNPLYENRQLKAQNAELIQQMNILNAYIAAKLPPG